MYQRELGFEPKMSIVNFGNQIIITLENISILRWIIRKRLRISLDTSADFLRWLKLAVYTHSRLYKKVICVYIYIFSYIYMYKCIDKIYTDYMIITEEVNVCKESAGLIQGLLGLKIKDLKLDRDSKGVDGVFYENQFDKWKNLFSKDEICDHRKQISHY